MVCSYELSTLSIRENHYPPLNMYDIKKWVFYREKNTKKNIKKKQIKKGIE